MKLKSAVKAVLSDAEISTGAKLEVVAFLRRYSSKIRPITHYSCRGQSTVALKKLLGLLDIKENEDFSVVASSYDPGFNQIRWIQDLSKICNLVERLSSVAGGDRHAGQLFDRMYVAITKNTDLDQFINVFQDDSDTEVVVADDTPPAVQELDNSHIAIRVMHKTSEIVKALCSLATFTDTGCGTSIAINLDADNLKKKNVTLAIGPVLEYLAEYFDTSSGEPKRPDAPYILPLPILELYARVMRNIPGPRGMPDNTLVFKLDPKLVDVFRLTRGDEMLMWSACLNAPLDYLWNQVSDSNNKNSLHGYFFRSNDSVLKANLDNKVGVFIGGNAALIHDASAEDNITPALCVSNHRDFWDYVIRIYAIAYGVSAGLSCKCRVGISNKLDVWTRETDVGDFINNVGQDVETLWRGQTGVDYGLVAMYGIFLGDDISTEYSDAYGFLDGSYPYKAIEVNEDNIPNFSATHLTKEESAWEWFAMTHLDEAASQTPQNTYTYGRQEADDPVTMANMAGFKKLISGITESNDTVWLAERSSCSTNKQFSPTFNDDEENTRYTSLSAFLEGLCVSIRKAWNPDNPHALALKKKSDNSRDGSLLITNVYSGIFTDLSPAVGSEKDTGEVFPCPLTSHSKTVSSALEDSEEDRKAFTNFLDRMATGKTMEQVKMAKRSAGTARSFAMIVETNLDAKTFLSEARSITDLWRDSGTVFLQNIILNGNNPGCAFDGAAILSASRTVRYEYHDVLERCCPSVLWNMMIPGSATVNHCFKLASGVYGTGGCATEGSLLVTARQDADGRLVLIFVVSGPMITYARMAYRIRCAFPLNTARTKEKTFSRFSHSDIVIKKNEWPSLNVAKNIISKHMSERSLDYEGSASSRSAVCGEGDAGPLFRKPIVEVPYRKCPSHDWFKNYTAFIDCAGVFYGDDPDDESEGSSDMCGA